MLGVAVFVPAAQLSSAAAAAPGKCQTAQPAKSRACGRQLARHRHQPKVKRRPKRPHKRPKRHHVSKPLPAPPRPAIFPSEPPGYRAPTALVSPTPSTTTSATPPQARTWGAPGPSTTLVVYDSTNTWGHLGSLYATAAGNMASRFGKVTAEPVIYYVPGQVNNYTATIYIGSTYDEPIPTAFLNDVLSTTRPVIWAGWNVWQLSGIRASKVNTAFRLRYGWDPSTSYIDTADDPTSVSYKGQTFTRDAASGANLVAPHITTATAVAVLALANCKSSTGAAANCASIAQNQGTSFPWAIRSSNLTYVSEQPFSYTSSTDRSLVFSDLLFGALG
jgi:uncharacterized protein YdaL